MRRGSLRQAPRPGRATLDSPRPSRAGIHCPWTLDAAVVWADESDPMDVSVVIPTLGRPQMLAAALDSVLSQEGPSIEVHVIDDGPDAVGEAVVAKLGDSRVSYRKMDVPTGGNPSRVRNVGWQASRGRFLHFLDDDDLVVPGAYQRMVALFDAHPRRGVAFGQVIPFGDDASALQREQRVFTTAARRGRILGRLGWRFLCVAHQLFASPTVLVNSACMVRREVVPRVGGYDEEIRVMEDIDFYARAIRASGFVFFDAPFVKYRTGAPSLMNDHRGKSVAPSYQRMYSKYAAEHGRVELRAAQIVAKAVLTHL
jgi:glycosyltransferase involved in cell wall biosynthesis